MSDQDEDVSAYEPMSLQVVGLSIPEGSATASLLVRNTTGKKMALQLDLEALLRAFEHVAHAMHTVALNDTGSYVHVPVDSFRVTPYEGSVAAALKFGTIGLFCMKLSESQASDLGQRLLKSAQQATPSNQQTSH